MVGRGIQVPDAADLRLTWSCCTPDTWQDACLIGEKMYTGSRCSRLKTPDAWQGEVCLDGVKGVLPTAHSERRTASQTVPPCLLSGLSFFFMTPDSRGMVAQHSPQPTTSSRPPGNRLIPAACHQISLPCRGMFAQHSPQPTLSSRPPGNRLIPAACHQISLPCRSVVTQRSAQPTTSSRAPLN